MLDVRIIFSVLNVSLTDVTGDPELFVSYGGQPTVNSYDCGSELGAGSNETCSFNNPQAGTWHIAVYGYADFSGVTLNANTSTSNIPPTGTPYISSPTAGSTLSGSSQTFNWIGNGASNVNYWIEAGSTLGGNDYYGKNRLTNLSDVVTGLPTDGSKVYVRLIYNNTDWDSVDYEYTSGGATTSSAVYYVHNNHLETPETITDKNQAVVWKASYSPYGEANITTETLSNNVRLPGQYYDTETGLHYNYFRYYDPKLGRYVTSDPIGLGGGINTYGYFGGNPTGYIDPLGLSPCDGISLPCSVDNGGGAPLIKGTSVSVAAGLSYNQPIDVRTQAQIDADFEKLGGSRYIRNIKASH